MPKEALIYSREPHYSPKRRLFFALYPSTDEREWLYALPPESCRQGARVSPGNLHVTLVFLGQCGEAEEASARVAADSVETGPVDLILDHLVVWNRAGVQVLLPPGTPPALRRLYTLLRQALVTQGFEPENRPWVPHVTLARRASPQPAISLAPVQLHFSQFHLFESRRVEGRLVYQPIGSWTLGSH